MTVRITTDRMIATRKIGGARSAENMCIRTRIVATVASG